MKDGCFAALHLYIIIGLRREHEVGHGHFPFCIEGLDAAAVDEDTQLLDGTVSRSLGHAGEVGAEAHVAALRAVHRKGLLGSVVFHDDLLALCIREYNLRLFLNVDDYLAGLRGLLHLLAAHV